MKYAHVLINGFVPVLSIAVYNEDALPSTLLCPLGLVEINTHDARTLPASEIILDLLNYLPDTFDVRHSSHKRDSITATVYAPEDMSLTEFRKIVWGWLLWMDSLED